MTVREPDVLELTREDNELNARLRLPEDLEFFRGHFDFQPILPAVVQVGWVLTFASEHLPVADSPESLDTLKFRKKLKPGDECSLTLEWDSEAQCLSFAIRQGSERVSSGRITVTGDP